MSGIYSGSNGSKKNWQEYLPLATVILLLVQMMMSIYIIITLNQFDIEEPEQTNTTLEIESKLEKKMDEINLQNQLCDIKIQLAQLEKRRR